MSTPRFTLFRPLVATRALAAGLAALSMIEGCASDVDVGGTSTEVGNPIVTEVKFALTSSDSALAALAATDRDGGAFTVESSVLQISTINFEVAENQVTTSALTGRARGDAADTRTDEPADARADDAPATDDGEGPGGPGGGDDGGPGGGDDDDGRPEPAPIPPRQSPPPRCDRPIQPGEPCGATPIREPASGGDTGATEKVTGLALDQPVNFLDVESASSLQSIDFVSGTYDDFSIVLGTLASGAQTANARFSFAMKRSDGRTVYYEDGAPRQFRLPAGTTFYLTPGQTAGLVLGVDVAAVFEVLKPDEIAALPDGRLLITPAGDLPPPNRAAYAALTARLNRLFRLHLDTDLDGVVDDGERVITLEAVTSE
jgi:hypothetical protein